MSGVVALSSAAPRLVWLTHGLRGRGHRWAGVAQERLCVSSGLQFEPLLVSQDAAVDGVGDASFEASSGLLDGLVFGDLASVVVAARAGVACLGDGGDVDGGVELAVASPRQSVRVVPLAVTAAAAASRVLFWMPRGA